MEYGAIQKRRRQSLGGRGQKWIKIADIYCAKTADMGEGGVKNWGIFVDVFYVRSLWRFYFFRVKQIETHFRNIVFEN